MQKREVGMWKRLLALLLAAMLSFTLSIPVLAANTSFSNVTANFWAYDAIQAAVSKGITNGYADGTFKPGSSVTNAHFAAFLARAFYADEYAEGSKSPWYKVYTDVLDEHGILDRTTLSKDFGGNINKPINRYDMAQMMRHILDDKNAEMPTNEEMAVARNAIGDWDSVPAEYRGAVSLCYAMGVLNGQKDGTFGGQNLMNRAQGCVVISRLQPHISGDSVSKPTPESDTTPTSDWTPMATKVLANGAAATEENVSALIEELRGKYYDGYKYDAYNPPYYSKAFGSNGIECAKFAFMFSDEIFGKDALLYHFSYPNYTPRPGDTIGWKDKNGNYYHWSTVVSTGDEGRGFLVRTVDGGPSGEVGWQDEHSSASFLDGRRFDVWTRYPIPLGENIKNGQAGENTNTKEQEEAVSAEMRCANCGFLMRELGGKINPNGDCFGECPTCHNWYLCGQCFSATAMRQHMDRCTG